MKMVFTSGRKYENLHSGVLRYADLQKKKHREPPDWTEGSHSKLAFKIGICVILKIELNIWHTILTFEDSGVLLILVFSNKNKSNRPFWCQKTGLWGV